MSNAYKSAAAKIICLYSDQKLGKTCGIVDTSWPADWRVYVHDIDGGFEFARKLWRKRGHPEGNLTIAPGNTPQEVHKGIWDLPPGQNLYVLDSFTKAMGRFKVYVQGKQSVEAGGLIEETDWKKIGGKISGYALDYFERWLQQVGRNDAWGLVICQERHDDVPGSDLTKVVPDLVGKARVEVASTANFVFHLELRKEAKAGQQVWVRKLRTRGTPTVMASDRSGYLDDDEPYDLAAIIAKVEAGRLADQPSNQQPPTANGGENAQADSNSSSGGSSASTSSV